jgi:hypothetical protein
VSRERIGLSAPMPDDLGIALKYLRRYPAAGRRRA